MVMAIACDQTRVFNMSMSKSDSNSTKQGYEKPHHTCTHEESIDEKLGYQPNASWFTKRSMENWAYFVEAFPVRPRLVRGAIRWSLHGRPACRVPYAAPCSRPESRR